MVSRAALVGLALLGCAPASSVGVARPQLMSAVVDSDGSAARPAPSASAAASAAAQRDDEALIRQFAELSRDGATASQLDQFAAEHPALRSAKAPPYGSALMHVLERGEEPAALALLRAGVDIDSPGLGGVSALRLAAGRQLDAVVKELLARGKKPNEAGYWGTALHAAASQGHATTLKILLEAGGDPNLHAEDHQFTPLIEAAAERREDAVKVLLAAKVDLEATDDDGRTALHWAVFAYRPEAVHIYRRMGAPHDTVFRDPGPAKVIELLLDAGAKIDAADDEGNTPLHKAVMFDARRAVELLVRRGANKAALNREKQTPRAIAAARRYDHLLPLLSPTTP